MQDQIVVLKNTKKGIEVDTVYSSNDTLFIDFNGKSTIEIPDKRIEVNNYPPPKDALDVIGIIAAIIAGLAAVAGAIAAFYQLFKKSGNLQSQVDKLTDLAEALQAQNQIIEEGNEITREYSIAISRAIQEGGGDNAELLELEERRLRLSVKPNLRVGGRMNAGAERLGFSITNEGHRCHVDNIEMLERQDLVNLGNLGIRPELRTGARIRLEGRTIGDNHPNRIEFRVRIEYHDEGDYRYESTIHWNQQRLTIETNEL